MIYRCRWCERGYCEDCLEFDKTTLIGNGLPEYELLGFPEKTQAFYISCPSCADHHIEDPAAKAFCDKKAIEIDQEYKQMAESKALGSGVGAVEAVKAVDSKAALTDSRAESMTDATTLADSGLSTPQVEFADLLKTGSSKKRKADQPLSKSTPTKQSQKFGI